MRKRSKDRFYTEREYWTRLREQSSDVTQVMTAAERLIDHANGISFTREVVKVGSHVPSRLVRRMCQVERADVCLALVQEMFSSQHIEPKSPVSASRLDVAQQNLSEAMRRLRRNLGWPRHQS